MVYKQGLLPANATCWTTQQSLSQAVSVCHKSRWGGGCLVSVAQQATPMQAVLIIVAPELCALMHITPIHHPIATVSSFAPTLSLLHGLSGLHEAI